MSSAIRARQLALGLPEAVEKPHFHKASFRVSNRIFATLDEQKNVLVVKLKPADHASSIESQPEIFHSVGWEHQGWTGIHLAQISSAQLQAMIVLAWKNVAPKRAVRAYEENL
ncbi:MAG: MmcQ/YjbR family DNA-binding protein [Xanthomonadales bacterium]|nr:MmcQ/YjbR family DNA-binding protein [Xanthomonadales bacterium]